MSIDDYHEAAIELERPARGLPGVPKVLARLLHAETGASGELGELSSMLKRHIVSGEKLDVLNLVEEAGDIVWYLALMLDAVGYTLDQALKANIQKLQYRAEFGKNKELERKKFFEPLYRRWHD